MGWRVISVEGRPDTHAGRRDGVVLGCGVGREGGSWKEQSEGTKFWPGWPKRSPQQQQQRQRFSQFSPTSWRARPQPLVLRQDYYSDYHDHSIHFTSITRRQVRDYRLVAKDSLSRSAFTHTPASSFRCCSHNRPRRQILDAECFLAQRPGTAPPISSWQQTLLRADGQVRSKQRGLSLCWPSYMPLILSLSLLLGTAPSRQAACSHALTHSRTTHTH